MNTPHTPKTLSAIIAVLALLLTTSSHPVRADVADLESYDDDTGWSFKERSGRYFYLTRGSAVWAHEFGFFKSPENCPEDRIYLTLSSIDERVKEFWDRPTTIRITVNDQEFMITTPMLGVVTLGNTHLMIFTNVRPAPELLSALNTAASVRAAIVEPAELVALVDFAEDEFAMNGFAASRRDADRLCRENALK